MPKRSVERSVDCRTISPEELIDFFLREIINSIKNNNLRLSNNIFRYFSWEKGYTFGRTFDGETNLDSKVEEVFRLLLKDLQNIDPNLELSDEEQKHLRRALYRKVKKIWDISLAQR